VYIDKGNYSRVRLYIVGNRVTIGGVMTPEQYEEGFKKLPCKACGSTNLMMVGDGDAVSGLFCKSCFETEEISVDEIKKRIESLEGAA
jgi:transcription elongation factor Elf1